MRHSAEKFGWMGRSMARSMVLCFCVLFAAFASAQTETTAPAPPADQTGAAQDSGPTLQQPAPESHVRAVRLSHVEGGVRVLQNGEVAFQQAELNMPVVQGMKLVTEQDGRAEIQFEDGSVARLAPNSSVTLTGLARDDDGTTITVIEADTGLVYYELNGRAGQYTVRFGKDSIAPVDSSIFRLDMDHPEKELAVMHGSVHVSDDENLALDVHTDQSMKFDSQNADEYQMSQSVTASTWDQWNSDRDDALAAMDENATEARANSAEPDNPAWSDLDANGNWYDVPGEGMGWSPSGVGDNWDPYGLGAWGYYSGIGYTWISGYSWGWWPYHCGGWSWFDGFGWMWFPGNCGWGGMGVGLGWYPYGTIAAAPPGYRCPRRPRRVHHPGRHPVHHPGGHPIRRPHHGPVLDPNLIAVNRGSKFTNQFRSVGVKTVPRLLFYDGQNIAPVKKTVRVQQGGPLGEGFASAMRRSRDGFAAPGSARSGIPSPGAPGRGAYARSMYRPSISAGRTVYQPGLHPRPGFTPPGRPAEPGRMPHPAPIYRAPARAPAFHAPPPPVYHAPPSFHPAPAPAFHPAPSFHPAPAPAGRGRH